MWERVSGRRCLGLRTCEGACAFDMLGVSSLANLGLCNLEWDDLIFYLS
jgi:Fe-S-cluster-containing dehydrogenase component